MMTGRPGFEPPLLDYLGEGNHLNIFSILVCKVEAPVILMTARDAVQKARTEKLYLLTLLKTSVVDL
jgi:hypothetical protein